MTDEHAHSPHKEAGKHEKGPSASLTYAGFALLAILFVAMIAYSYTQFAALQTQVNKVTSVPDRLSGAEARLQQVEALIPKPAQIQLLYDSSCAFCGNAELFDDVDAWNFENEPKGLRMVPVDVKDRLGLVRNSTIPYVPTVLITDTDARRNSFSWNLVRQVGESGPVFVAIAGGYYGALATEGHPRPVQLTGDSCKDADRLTVDLFYRPRCPECDLVRQTLEAYNRSLGPSLVVREHCLPTTDLEIGECRRLAPAAFNQTQQRILQWGISFAPTTGAWI